MKTLFSFLFLVLSSTIQAQTTFRHALGLQFGVPMLTMSSKIKASTPLVLLQIERRISHVGIAFFLSTAEFEGYHEEHILNIYNTTSETGSLELIGLRGNYYFLQQEKLELYGGVMASYLAADAGIFLKSTKVDTKYRTGTIGEDPASHANGFKVGFQAGGRYWFRERFGVTGELAYGTALCNLGIAFRF